MTNATIKKINIQHNTIISEIANEINATECTKWAADELQGNFEIEREIKTKFGEIIVIVKGSLVKCFIPVDNGNDLTDDIEITGQYLYDIEITTASEDGCCELEVNGIDQNGICDAIREQIEY